MARTRQTKVSLVAEVNGYVNGMAKAAKATRDTGTEAEKLAQKRQGMEALGTSVLAIGAVAAAGVGLAVAKFAEFDQAMSEVQASTQESATNMALLRQAALDFGASSVFTATEAANAIEELGKAGLSTADILEGGLAGALDLASAGGLGIARAAEISATTLQQFNLAGSESGRVADALAAGAGKALGSVEDLANGLKFVGPVAAGMNVSLEDTTGVLAMFAQQGIIGEQAGTSLRGMLAALTSPSKIAAGEIEKLGLQLYDAQGNFLGLENAAGQLQGAYSGMTDEQRDFSLGVLFGNETVTAARVLYQGGAEGVREWSEAVTESGYAGQVARDRLDNLRGDIEALGGAFDTALIQTGTAANDSLRGLVQTLTFFVEAVGDMPDPVFSVGTALGGAVAAIGLTGGAALVAVPRIAEFKTGLDALNLSAKTAAVGFGVLSAAVAGVSLGIGYFISQQVEAKQRTDDLRSSLSAQTGAATESTKELVTAALAARDSFLWLELPSAYDAAEQLGFSLDTVTDAALGNSKAYNELRDSYDAAVEAAGGVDRLNAEQYDAYTKLFGVVDEYRGSLEVARDQADQIAEANGEAADSADAAVAAFESQGVALAGATEATEQLTDAEIERRQVFADADAEFVGLGAAMGAVQEAQRSLAENTAQTTEDSTDSWEDYYGGVQVTTAGVIEELRKQVEAQTNWESNMIALSGRVSQGVLDELADLGPEGAPLVQAFVDATDEELAEMESLWANRSENAVRSFSDQMSLSAPVMIQLAEKIGRDAADGVARELAEGKTTVGEVMEEYELTVEGVKPEVQVLTGQARREINQIALEFERLSRAAKIDLVIERTGAARGVVAAAYADGGAVSGPGGPREDNILIRASAGEHVLDAADVRAMGGQDGVYRFREMLHAAPRYADGGAVRYAPAAPSVTAAPASSQPSREVTQVFQVREAVSESILAQKAKLAVNQELRGF